MDSVGFWLFFAESVGRSFVLFLQKKVDDVERIRHCSSIHRIAADTGVSLAIHWRGCTPDDRNPGTRRRSNQDGLHPWHRFEFKLKPSAHVDDCVKSGEFGYAGTATRMFCPLFDIYHSNPEKTRYPPAHTFMVRCSWLCVTGFSRGIP